MGWTMMRRGGRWWVLGVLLAFGVARTAAAIYLDDNENISLRARVYTQGAWRLQDSQGDTTPTVKTGQLVQHRNFFNPELGAKLVSYTSWMKDSSVLSLIAPDQFDFRLAAWGFYDGIYDYGPRQFADRLVRPQYIQPPTAAGPIPQRALFYKASDVNQILSSNGDLEDPRNIYGYDRRVNELYLTYAKGPFFLRVGKQAISWGESDTVALLDQNNPFDLTLGAPGVFEDVDEARIPLWTIRTTYSLFDSWGPFSSAFVEAYWVPGGIDTTTATVPPPSLGPYNSPAPDPQSNPLLLVLHTPQTVLVDQRPAATMANSRYGFRFETVVARDYTVSAWMYATFNQAPVPRIDSVSVPLTSQQLCVPYTKGPNKGQCEPVLPIELVHQLVPVVGLSNTFYFQPLDGIVRMEGEYFNREPAFKPGTNLLIPQLDTNPNLLTNACRTSTGAMTQCKGHFVPVGQVPHADFLRWELGFDRFFFFRPLNPANSFTWVSALVGSYNMDETSHSDFYYDGQEKPGSYSHAHPLPSDFVQLQKVEMFAQTHLQTDYMHGRLTPQITLIGNVRGAYAVLPQVTYRYSDSLLFDVAYTTIGGAFTQLGFFRDRDQIALRATYQLN